jgi:2-methylcitrate dehydratase PrpD
MGKTAKDIKEVTNRTHEACIRIIDKQFKAMDNFADRDHCVQVGFQLEFGLGIFANLDSSTWLPPCWPSTA